MASQGSISRKGRYLSLHLACPIPPFSRESAMGRPGKKRRLPSKLNPGICSRRDDQGLHPAALRAARADLPAALWSVAVLAGRAELLAAPSSREADSARAVAHGAAGRRHLCGVVRVEDVHDPLPAMRAAARRGGRRGLGQHEDQSLPELPGEPGRAGAACHQAGMTRLIAACITGIWRLRRVSTVWLSALAAGVLAVGYLVVLMVILRPQYIPQLRAVFGL